MFISLCHSLPCVSQNTSVIVNFNVTFDAPSNATNTSLAAAISGIADSISGAVNAVTSNLTSSRTSVVSILPSPIGSRRLAAASSTRRYIVVLSVQVSLSANPPSLRAAVYNDVVQLFLQSTAGELLRFFLASPLSSGFDLPFANSTVAPSFTTVVSAATPSPSPSAAAPVSPGTSRTAVELGVAVWVGISVAAAVVLCGVGILAYLWFTKSAGAKAARSKRPVASSRVVPMSTGTAAPPVPPPSPLRGTGEGQDLVAPVDTGAAAAAPAAAIPEPHDAPPSALEIPSGASPQPARTPLRSASGRRSPRKPGERVEADAGFDSPSPPGEPEVPSTEVPLLRSPVGAAAGRGRLRLSGSLWLPTLSPGEAVSQPQVVPGLRAWPQMPRQLAWPDAPLSSPASGGSVPEAPPPVLPVPAPAPDVPGLRAWPEAPAAGRRRFFDAEEEAGDAAAATAAAATAAGAPKRRSIAGGSEAGAAAPVLPTDTEGPRGGDLEAGSSQQPASPSPGLASPTSPAVRRVQPRRSAVGPVWIPDLADAVVIRQPPPPRRPKQRRADATAAGGGSSASPEEHASLVHGALQDAEARERELREELAAKASARRKLEAKEAEAAQARAQEAAALRHHEKAAALAAVDERIAKKQQLAAADKAALDAAVAEMREAERARTLAFRERRKHTMRLVRAASHGTGQAHAAAAATTTTTAVPRSPSGRRPVFSASSMRSKAADDDTPATLLPPGAAAAAAARRQWQQQAGKGRLDSAGATASPRGIRGGAGGAPLVDDDDWIQDDDDATGVWPWEAELQREAANATAQLHGHSGRPRSGVSGGGAAGALLPGSLPQPLPGTAAPDAGGAPAQQPDSAVAAAFAGAPRRLQFEGDRLIYPPPHPHPQHPAPLASSRPPRGGDDVVVVIGGEGPGRNRGSPARAVLKSAGGERREASHVPPARPLPGARAASATIAGPPPAAARAPLLRVPTAAWTSDGGTQVAAAAAPAAGGVTAAAPMERSRILPHRAVPANRRSSDVSPSRPMLLLGQPVPSATAAAAPLPGSLLLREEASPAASNLKPSAAVAAAFSGAPREFRSAGNGGGGDDEVVAVLEGGGSPHQRRKSDAELREATALPRASRMPVTRVAAAAPAIAGGAAAPRLQPSSASGPRPAPGRNSIVTAAARPITTVGRAPAAAASAQAGGAAQGGYHTLHAAASSASLHAEAQRQWQRSRRHSGGGAQVAWGDIV
jgi:hypothetical protein